VPIIWNGSIAMVITLRGKKLAGQAESMGN